APLPRRRPRHPPDPRHELQPADEDLFARPRHRRELSRVRGKGRGLTGPAVGAVLFDLDGTLADTAPDLARALNRLRTERGLGPVPPALTRPHTSSGARGMLGGGMGVRPDHGSYAE